MQLTRLYRGTNLRSVIIILCLIISMSVITLKYKIIVISGTSMYPLYATGSIVIMKTYDAKTSLKRGDIISIHLTLDNISNLNIVKRVIACEGNTVTVENNKVTVDGVATYLADSFTHSYPEAIYHLQEGEYFVLGDNLNNSVDSRDKRIGVIKSTQITAFLDN